MKDVINLNATEESVDDKRLARRWRRWPGWTVASDGDPETEAVRESAGILPLKFKAELDRTILTDGLLIRDMSMIF